MPATDGIPQATSPLALKLPPVVGQILFASTIPALALGFFILMRRASGALTSSLPPTDLIATATILGIWAAAVRLFATPHSNRLSTLCLPLGIILLFAIACSYPGDRIVDWLTWSVAVAPILFIHLRVSTGTPPRGPLSHAQSLPVAPTPDIESESQQILQQLTRLRDADGRESIHGTLIAEFAPGERKTTLFVAFCPPFEYLPEVEVEITDDSSTDVKLVQVLHNGVELEVRLPQPASSPTSITVELFAAESQSSGR
jgi:hypothetical protein